MAIELKTDRGVNTHETQEKTRIQHREWFSYAMSTYLSMIEDYNRIADEISNGWTDAFHATYKHLPITSERLLRKLKTSQDRILTPQFKTDSAEYKQMLDIYLFLNLCSVEQLNQLVEFMPVGVEILTLSGDSLYKIVKKLLNGNDLAFQELWSSVMNPPKSLKHVNPVASLPEFDVNDMLKGGGFGGFNSDQDLAA